MALANAALSHYLLIQRDNDGIGGLMQPSCSRSCERARGRSQPAHQHSTVHSSLHSQSIGKKPWWFQPLSSATVALGSAVGWPGSAAAALGSAAAALGSALGSAAAALGSAAAALGSAAAALVSAGLSSSSRRSSCRPSGSWPSPLLASASLGASCLWVGLQASV